MILFDNNGFIFGTYLRIAFDIPQFSDGWFNVSNLYGNSLSMENIDLGYASPDSRIMPISPTAMVISPEVMTSRLKPGASTDSPGVCSETSVF